MTCIATNKLLTDENDLTIFETKTLMLKILINPFQKLPNRIILIIGIASIMFSSFLAAHVGIHFEGMFSVQLGESDGFFEPLMENTINLIILGVLTWAGISFIAKLNVTIAKLFAGITFSRVPLLFATILGFVPGINKENPYTFENIGIGLLMIVFGIWSIVWLYYAIKTMGDLSGDKKWTIFIFVGIASALASSYLHSYF